MVNENIGLTIGVVIKGRVVHIDQLCITDKYEEC